MTDEPGGDAEEPTELPLRRRVGIAALVVVATVLAGALVGNLLVAGDKKPSRRAEVSRLEPARVGDVQRAVEASPKELDPVVGMGSHHAGIAVTALDEVDDVRTPEGRRRAPDGGRLIVFKVGDWTCETEPCASWKTLEPRVLIEGDGKDLPADGDTFVVVLGPGASEVDLEIEADGYTQAVSLVDGSAGASNIELLADPDEPQRTELDKTFRMTEQTSVALDDGSGPGHDLYYRDAMLDYAELGFFVNGATPSDPDDAFLAVNAYFSYANKTDKYVFPPNEATFVAKDGTRYQARDLDPSESIALLGFQVPADLRSGTLVLGGVTPKTSTTGLPYTSTLLSVRIPITIK